MSTIRQRIDAMHKADREYHKLDYAFPIDHATKEQHAALVAATQVADALDGALIADWITATELLKESLPEIEAIADEHANWLREDEPVMILYRKVEEHIARMAGLHDGDGVV